MSGPQNPPSAEQPVVTPTVSTAPARSRWHWSALPSHLGRARTSTVVLAVLFLAVFALYLNIRPATPGTTPTGGTGTGGVQQPADPTTPAPTTSAPEPSTTPETSTEETPTTTEEPSSTTAEPTDSTEPTDTTEPTSTLPTLTRRPTAPNTSPSTPTP